jgi:nucleotide-binding universal stress UspA family protein
MKNILIPTDFSRHSEYALEYVLDLINEINLPCRLILVNTFIVNKTDHDLIIYVNDHLKKISKDGLAAQKEIALKKKSKTPITVETISQMGSLNNVILQFLQRERIDLVAMGKDGGRHVENVSAILKKLHCPLLITYV